MSRTTLRVALAVSAGSLVLPGTGVRLRAQDQPRPMPTAVWAPKPTQTPVYTPPQKPWIKLADIKAKHTGEANWRELLVDDGRLTGEYIAARRARKWAAAFTRTRANGLPLSKVRSAWRSKVRRRSPRRADRS